MIEACQLSDTDMREISRTHPEKTPMALGRRGEFKLMPQVLVFFHHAFGISVNGKLFQKPGLAEKNTKARLGRKR